MQKSEIFKARLTVAMQKAKLSPSELARQMKTNPSTVSRWTSGSVPHARTLEKLEGLLQTELLPPPAAKAEPPEISPPDVTKEATFLLAAELDQLQKVAPGASTGILLGGMWTALNDILNYRLPLDKFVTAKLAICLTELDRRAKPAPTSYPAKQGLDAS